jgi:hypothetical protein
MLVNYRAQQFNKMFKLEIKNRFQLLVLENLSIDDTDTIPVNDEWQKIHKIYTQKPVKMYKDLKDRYTKNG